MNILPSFYHLFECIGTKCVNTCCAGWTVTLDSDTVHYYESQTDDFGTFIKQNLTEQNDEKAIVLTDTKRCPFLSTEGLCQIYMHYGEEHMSRTCKEFPRRRWILIFGITDTFCQVIKEAELYGWQDFLWPAHIFERNDAQRKDYLISCWNSQHPSQEHTAFFRKVAALCFMGHSLALDVDSGENIYLRDISNFILLAAVLPSTWNLPKEHSLSDYFSRLSHISRRFEQSNVIKKFVYPIIQDLFAPDLYAYASAFMVLFDNNTNA